MFMKSLLAIAGLAISLLAGTASAQGYRIQPGDTLSIEVLEDDTLNRQVLVLPDGTITFPMAGTLPAAGRSPEQLRETLSTRLAPNFASPPNIYVAVSRLKEDSPGVAGQAADAVTQNVYVMGEAVKPGLIEVEPGTTLLQALAVAGGFGKFAATRRVQLHRATGQANQVKIYAFDYNRPAGGKGTISGATVLAPGDVIVIPQRRLFE